MHRHIYHDETNTKEITNQSWLESALSKSLTTAVNTLHPWQMYLYVYMFIFIQYICARVYYHVKGW